jgi:hypothetical protein
MGLSFRVFAFSTMSVFSQSKSCSIYNYVGDLPFIFHPTASFSRSRLFFVWPGRSRTHTLARHR